MTGRETDRWKIPGGGENQGGEDSDGLQTGRTCRVKEGRGDRQVLIVGYM